MKVFLCASFPNSSVKICHFYRYPWRHFCLDPSDSGVESDTEIWASDIIPTSAVPSNSIVKVEEDNELDTDEEIEKLEREEKNKEKEKTKKPALKKGVKT